MNKENGIVLIHGAWHDSHTWDNVIPILEGQGFAVTAVDLPGAGPHAAAPASYALRPLDLIAFATEPSPNAGVSQDERSNAVIEAARALNAQTGGKALVVGHSLGGLTVAHVAEQITDEISAAVFLTAFMLPPGMVAGEVIEHPSMEKSTVPALLKADPAQIGAMRIDPKSSDAEYRAQGKETFFADLTDEQFERALSHLHPDEPAQVVGVPSPVTQKRFGIVPRHFIRCTLDNAVTLEGQDEMIRLTDETMGNATVIHTLESSHSPFHSQPETLAKIISSIA